MCPIVQGNINFRANTLQIHIIKLWLSSLIQHTADSITYNVYLTRYRSFFNGSSQMPENQIKTLCTAIKEAFKGSNPSYIPQQWPPSSFSHVHWKKGQNAYICFLCTKALLSSILIMYNYINVRKIQRETVYNEV